MLEDPGRARERKPTTATVVGLLLAALLGAYFLAFGVIVLDDAVLGQTLYRHTPRAFRQAMKVVYRPLLRLLNRVP